jgi:hypothetical protein
MTKTLRFIGLVITKVERSYTPPAEPNVEKRQASAGMGVLVFILALVTAIALTMATLFGSYCTR